MALTKGYFQIPMTEQARRYAVFVTPFGSFLPTKMMFGLLNSGFFFCKINSQILNGLEEFALPYVDAIAIYSKNWNHHLNHIDIVLTRLSAAGLKVKPSKCVFPQ